jgi:hypothetical protein
MAAASFGKPARERPADLYEYRNVLKMRLDGAEQRRPRLREFLRPLRRPSQPPGRPASSMRSATP